MNEVTGELWEFEADAHVITTNGFVKRSGELVMGRGCAYQARQMFPGLDVELGRMVSWSGNHVYHVGSPNVDTIVKNLVSFPVKRNWWEYADEEIIERSTQELIDLTNAEGWDSVVLPRPGVGNGRLSWDDVKPIIDILDDRFYVITWE